VHKIKQKKTLKCETYTNMATGCQRSHQLIKPAALTKHDNKEIRPTEKSRDEETDTNMDRSQI